MTGASVELAVPAGWSEAPLAPPEAPGGGIARVATWRAWAPPGAGPRLVAGCLESSPPGWAPEVEPIALDGIHAVVTSTAVRLAGAGGIEVSSSSRTDRLVTERAAGVGAAHGRLAAKVFLGFEAPAAQGGDVLASCFALCAGDLGECAASVEGATLQAELVPPPRPSWGARALVAVTHHPTAAGRSLVAVALALAAAAVLTRRRPRAK